MAATQEAKVTQPGAIELASNGSSLWERLFFAVGPYLFLILLWEGLRRLLHADASTMPSLWSAVEAIGRVAANGILPDYIFHSLERITVAGLVSVVIGVSVGTTIGLNSTVAAFLLPVIRYFNSLAGIAWLPLFLIWFGFNDKTILLAISYNLFFPVVFNTIIGIRTVPKVLRQGVLTLGGSWRDVVFSVMLPGALPNVISGIRLGVAYGWRALIASEMLLGLGGIGYMIFKAQANDLTDRILAGMLLIGILWSLMDYLILQPLEETTVRRWGLVRR